MSEYATETTRPSEAPKIIPQFPEQFSDRTNLLITKFIELFLFKNPTFEEKTEMLEKQCRLLIDIEKRLREELNINLSPIIMPSATEWREKILDEDAGTLTEGVAEQWLTKILLVVTQQSNQEAAKAGLQIIEDEIKKENS